MKRTIVFLSLVVNSFPSILFGGHSVRAMPTLDSVRGCYTVSEYYVDHRIDAIITTPEKPDTTFLLIKSKIAPGGSPAFEVIALRGQNCSKISSLSDAPELLPEAPQYVQDAVAKHVEEDRKQRYREYIEEAKRNGNPNPYGPLD